MLRKEDILTLEYFNDMKNYYRFAYGNDLNKRLACKLVTKLVNSVEKYLNGTSPVKAELFFTHSETFLFLYTILVSYKKKWKFFLLILPFDKFLFFSIGII